MPAIRPSALGILGFAWGVLGVCLLLGAAAVGLVPPALEPVRDGMGTSEWAAYVGSILLMAYAEGYQGFQRAFSPRVVVRGWHLLQHPRLLHVVFAPLFCMALFHASRRRLIVAYVILVGVVSLVSLLRAVEQPWRGIVDIGVVVGLSWGVLATVVYAVQALGGHRPALDAGLPERADVEPV